MQSVHSYSSSHEPEIPSAPTRRPLTNANAFIVTPEDADVLNGYLEEFRNSNTQEKRRLMEKAMGDLYRLRHDDFTFDKRDAKEVSTVIVDICVYLLRDICSRK